MRTFSDIETIIAKHFIELGIAVTNKTLSTLSENIGFSEVTIFRFVKKIGFEDFKILKYPLPLIIVKKNDHRHDLIVFSDITGNDSSYIIA